MTPLKVEDLLKKSMELKGSDLHLLPNLPPLLRVYGELGPIKDTPVLDANDVRKLIYDIMTMPQQEVLETHLVVEFALSVPDIGNFRVSVFHQNKGIAAVFRVIPETPPSFDELGLPRRFQALLNLSHGLIIVTGATGSGKSTTLAAMIDFINATRSCNIITIEDPIEYIHPNKKSAVNQLQVGRDTRSMKAALRASLRQDPDVILVGEMRDLETIRLALTAAETGHLVLTTLHASSAPFSISRMIDVFPRSEQPRVRNILSEALQAIIYQTLVKKISGGRIAAFEVMIATHGIRHLIRQDMASHMESAIQTGGEHGMCTLDQYLQELLSKNLITPTTARSQSAKKGSFNA